MPKGPTKSTTEKSTDLIEAQVIINPRGRSVMNGTLLYDGVMETFKHELTPSLRGKFVELILSASIHH